MTADAPGPVDSDAAPFPRDAGAWVAALAPDGPWTEVVVVDETASTNADLVAYAQEHAGHGRVLVAELQTAGRGRLDRTWSAPRGTGLTFSVLTAPQAPPGAWGWAPLLAGLAVAEAIEQRTGLHARVKWPNDIVVDDRKLGGLLCEVVPPDRLVIGIGVNTHLRADARPTPEATSLILEGVDASAADRAGLLVAILDTLAARMATIGQGPSDEAMGAYRARCVSLGHAVRVERPGHRDLQGTAVDVADDAALVVDVMGRGAVHVAAGDVVHLR